MRNLFSLSWRSDEDESDQRMSMLCFQAFSIAVLAVAGLGVWGIEHFFPNFFNYPYFSRVLYPGDVIGFWPLFGWAAAWALINAVLADETSSAARDYEFFALGALSSVLAGVWEEIGFRCLFICYAMILIIAFNWIFSTAFLVVVIIAIGVFALFLLSEVEQKFWKVLGLAICGIGLWAAWVYVRNFDLLIWLYDFFIWIADWLTFKQFSDTVFYGRHEHIFIIGAFLANLWFRDGHKYQGPIGWINSWYVGIILLYTMLTYGLLTAIAVHAIYDLIFDVTLLLRRRLTGN